MKYLISLNFKYLSMRMNREESVFNREKCNFKHIGNTVHTTDYLSLGKALLATLYLEVKVYINLLSAHNLLCLE